MRSRVLLEALAADHAVHVAVPIAADEERANAVALAQVVPVRVHELDGSAHRGHALRKAACWLRGRSELLARRWSPRAKAAAAAMASRLDPALVVADSSFVLPVLPGDGRPLLLHLHNVESAVFARAGGVARPFVERVMRRLEARTIARAERAAIRRARMTVTVSEPDRELVRAMVPGAEVVTVPNSIGLQRLSLQPLPPPGPLRLLFIGKLDYPPNLEAVTELVEQHLPALRAAFPGLVVRIVGGGAADRVAELGRVPGVEAMGAVDDVLPHYRASHAAYLPIRSGGGTRIKILEAWALGLPVLATAIATEGLVAQDGVHFRRFETVEQGVAALREVAAGQGALLRSEGRTLVEAHHSQSTAVARLREITAALLAG